MPVIGPSDICGQVFADKIHMCAYLACTALILLCNIREALTYSYMYMCSCIVLFVGVVNHVLFRINCYIIYFTYELRLNKYKNIVPSLNILQIVYIDYLITLDIVCSRGRNKWHWLWVILRNACSKDCV